MYLLLGIRTIASVWYCVKRYVGHRSSGSVLIARGYKLDKHISRVISEPADARLSRLHTD